MSDSASWMVVVVFAVAVLAIACAMRAEFFDDDQDGR